jgi:hypothetical protein
MRRWTLRGLHASAVLLGFLLVLEGPDLLLLGVRDARFWGPVGIVSGLLTLPLLWVVGVGFAPPWTLPVYRDGKMRLRVAGYHLVCTTLAAWLWTAPTLRAVAWVHERRGFAATGSLEDVVSVAAGLLLAELLFLFPTVVLFVRLSAFQTDVDLSAARTVKLLRTALLAVGLPLVVGFVVTVGAVVLTTTP